MHLDVLSIARIHLDGLRSFPWRSTQSDGRIGNLLGNEPFEQSRTEPAPNRLVEQPFPEAVERFGPRKDLTPRDPSATAIRLLDGGVEDGPAGPPNVGTRTVSLNERDEGRGKDGSRITAHGSRVELE